MEHQAEKVSVIIPTYNRENLIVDAINSVRNQTYSNLEIIIVDDCSTDHTRERVEALGDPRIIYVSHEQNKGGARARNTGIERATGEYIAFLDSDDQWLPTKLEKQMERFKENPKIGAVYTGVTTVSGTVTRGVIIPQHQGDILPDLLVKNCVGTTSTAVIRRRILLDIGGFDPELPSCQDWDLWVRLAKNTKFDVVQEPLVLFNEHEGDRITTNKLSVILGLLTFYEKHESLIWALNKKSFHLSHLNMAKVLMRAGIVGQNGANIKKGREFLKLALRAYPFPIETIVLYIGSFCNKRVLFMLYTFFKRNTSPFLVTGFKNTCGKGSQEVSH